MKKTILSTLILSIVSLTALAQIVNIPDANFKAYLVGNSSINTNSDTEIQVSEATAYTGVIDCNSLSISDLTGIEAFINISELYCVGNNLSTLNVSQNVNLTMLYCNSNNLTSLDLSQNTSLTELSIAFNSFTSVDISNNTLLSKFYCSHNNLSSLDVSQNINLTELGCEYNAINTLDLSQNTNLIQLTCHYNSIISLDVSQNTNLGNLTCHHNNISSLDVSQNTALYTLRCQNNDLTMLKSINTSTLVNLNATVNPNLTCVEVDDIAAANANLNYVIDATASYSTNCVILVSSITVQGQGGASTIATNGGTLQMEATVLPTNATDATYTWSVANGTGSATIDANGLLTALTNGTVTVTATANDGSGVTGDAVITISNQIILVNSISVQGQSGASTITTNGGTLQMEATVLPTNATDATYTWSVANGTGSASIDANGLLTALTNGTVTVTATANDGSGVSGTKDITISNQGTAIKDIAFKGLSLYPNPTNDIVNLKVDEKLTSLRLYDLTGKTVKTFSADNTQLNVSDIQQGVYFLELKNEDKRSVIKLIID